MAKVKREQRPPSGLMRLLLRAPIWLYRLRLGWLLGNRFLLLHHVGRKSGQARQAVVEVAGYDRQGDTYLVASGWGWHSNWYLNVKANPEVTLEVGRRRVTAWAEPLSPQASGQALLDYARRYPRAARSLARMLGHKVSGAEEEYERLGRERVPFVAFHCRREGA